MKKKRQKPLAITIRLNVDYVSNNRFLRTVVHCIHALVRSIDTKKKIGISVSADDGGYL